MPSSSDQNRDYQGPKRQNKAALPSFGVVLVVAVSAIYGWWQNGNPPAPPQPAGAVKNAQTTDQAGDKTAPIITPTRRDPNSIAADAQETPPPAGEIQITPSKRSKTPQTKPQPPPTTVEKARPTLIPQVTLKDQDGDVIYQGPIDLQPTLDRIAKGQRNSHRNDGSVFQNREGRLARKPSGYYHEYVVPTPKQGGPGPQRLILGKGGEVFYTADHYRSFRRIDVKILAP